MFYVWLIPLIILAGVVLWFFLAVVKNRGGPGRRSSGDTIVGEQTSSRRSSGQR
jgi:hypothetical protein